MHWLDIARKEVGQKEVSGAANNARILEYLNCTTYGSREGDETPWCFTGDIEILTAEGWRRFDQLGDEGVAQVDPVSLEVSFVAPIRKIRKDFDGELVRLHARNIDVACDPEHRFFGKWNCSGKGEYEKRPITDLTSILHVPNVRGGSLDAPYSDRDIQLIAAFLADGCIHRGRIAFQVSRERKIDALTALSPDYVYVAKKVYGPRTKSPLSTFEFATPSWFDSCFDFYKVLSWKWLLSLSARQLQLFVDTYGQFDGALRGKSVVVTTVSEAIKDSLVAAATLAGYTPRYRVGNAVGLGDSELHNITWCPEKRSTTLLPGMMFRERAQCELFCVEVPSGLIVIRDRAGTPLVTGNCSAFMNWVMMKAGLPYTKNAAARSWLSWGEPIHDPVPGCVVVFWRDSPQSWAGHVALYVGEGPNNTVTVLGGNQGNSVCEANYDKRRVLGFRWPKGIPIPEPVVAAPNAVTVDVEYIERLNASMLTVSQDLKTSCEMLLNAANQIGAWAAALPLEEKTEATNAG